MRRLIHSLVLTALTFFAVSCQQENLEPVASGNSVTYTIQIPDVLMTKTSVPEKVDRLIYQVYRKADIDSLTKRPIYTGTADINDAGKAELVMEFVRQQEFIVLFWAQNSTAEVYDTADLRKVSIVKEKLSANDFSAEAFSGFDTVKDCISASNGDVDLTRPISQINIITSEDGLTLGQTTQIKLEQSEMIVDGLYDIYNVYNGQVASQGIFAPRYTFTKADVPTKDFKSGYKYVAMSYVGFAGNASANINVRLDIYTSEGKIHHNVNNIPVKANYRTNILGNLITGNAGYAVTIDKAWASPDAEVVAVAVSTADDLQDAINEIPAGVEGNIQLEGDIDLGMISTKSSTPSYGLMIPPGKTLILDLNGCTLKQEVEQTAGYSMIQNNGHLTIIDSKGTGNPGKISYTDKGNGGEYVSNTIVNNATMIIESGVIENNSSANVAANGYPHPVDNNGNLTINGGTLSNNANYASMRIWCTTDDNTSVTINGGTFKGSIDFQTVNSSPNKGVLTINGGTFKADSYTNSAVRLLGFGADVDEMFGYIKGGNFEGEIAIRNWSGQEMNSQVFYISGGTFNTDVNNFTAETSVAIKEGEVWVIRDAYAKVGNTKYTSLEAALKAASDKETVTVLADTEIGAPFTLANGKTLTLDLNGKTVAGSSSVTGKNFDMIDVRGTLTVKNGTITAKFTGENMGWNNSTNVFNVTAGGVLNLDSVTAKNLGGSDMGFVAHLNNWGEVTLNVENSTLESNYVAVRVFNSGNDMNNVTIKNSTLQGGSYAFWVHNYTAADFDGDVEKAAHQQTLLNLDIFGNGNTFIGKNDTPIRYGMTDAVYTAVPSAVKIGETEYATLQEAFNVGGEITLLYNLTLTEPAELVEGKNVVLNLNGKTINTISEDGYVIMNDCGSTLEIKDTATEGIINGVVYTESSTTTINGGTYNAVEGGKYVFLNSKGTLTINNAIINGGSSYPVYSYDEQNKLVINNAIVNAPFGCVNSYGLGGEVVINGGTFQMTGVQGKTSHIAYFSNVDATINGGTFEKIGDISMSGTGGGGICAIYGASLTINDGTFKGDYADVYDWGGTNSNGRAVSITVKGGTYKFKPGFLAEGYESVQNADGTWTVVKVQPNNEIWYTGDEKLEPTTPTAFNANIVSNVWDSTTGKGVITFDAPLTAIGNEAFKRITNTTPSNWMTSISLPNSLETIGNYAFYQCFSLTSITIPDSVTSIGQYAFGSCRSVTTVTIGSSVTSIASGAFYEYWELKDFICKPTTPPTLADKWVFSTDYRPDRVIVPTASVEAYKAADFWKDLNIVAE